MILLVFFGEVIDAMQMSNDHQQILREEKDHRWFTATHLNGQENAIEQKQTIVYEERLE